MSFLVWEEKKAARPFPSINLTWLLKASVDPENTGLKAMGGRRKMSRESTSVCFWDSMCLFFHISEIRVCLWYLIAAVGQETGLHSPHCLYMCKHKKMPALKAAEGTSATWKKTPRDVSKMLLLFSVLLRYNWQIK